MSFESVLIEPRGREAIPNLVGLYALQVASDIQKNGDILQMAANDSGVSFFVSDLFMQRKRRIFDMAAKDANQPTQNVYRDMSLRRNDFFLAQLDKEGLTDNATVGIGDSLGVAAIQGMQRYSSPHSPIFDALLLRDGWNLRQANKAYNILRFAIYTAVDRIQQGSYRPTVDDIEDYGYRRHPLEPDETRHDFEKVWNVADIMRTPLNRELAIKLASRGGFAMNVVLFEHGASGNSERQQAYVNQLYNVSPISNAAYFRAGIKPGWHSDLLDPRGAADDILQTVGLLGGNL
jgi:hypothetical protein